MTVGERIKDRREELHISQDELAQRLGYKSRSSINKIELDKQKLRPDKIKELADALETTPDYIMGWGDGSDEEVIELHLNMGLSHRKLVQYLKDAGCVEVVEGYHKLDYSDRATLDQMIQFLLDKEKYKTGNTEES